MEHFEHVRLQVYRLVPLYRAREIIEVLSGPKVSHAAYVQGL